MTFATPHGAGALPPAVELVGVRLPRALRAAVGAVRRARFEIAEGRAAARATRRAHRPRRPGAPLIVDALGWRRVLARRALPAARRAALARPRGPSAGRRRRPRRLDRALARRAAATAGASRPAARRASASAPTTRATTSGSRRAVAARVPTRRRALPGQLVPAPPARGRRGRRVLRRRQRRALLPALRRGHPHRLLLRDRRGPRAPRRAGGEQTPRAGARRATPRSRTPTRPAFRRALRLQRLIPALPAAPADRAPARRSARAAARRPRLRLVPRRRRTPRPPRSTRLPQGPPA